MLIMLIQSRNLREKCSVKMSVSWNFDNSTVIQYVLGAMFLVSALNRSISHYDFPLIC